MSRTTAQQTAINKAVDAVEKSLKAWVVLAGRLQQAVVAACDTASLEEQYERQEEVDATLARMDEMLQAMLATAWATTEKVRADGFGKDTATAPNYHRQCEMLEGIVDAVRAECIAWHVAALGVGSLPADIVSSTVQELVRQRNLEGRLSPFFSAPPLTASRLLLRCAQAPPAVRRSGKLQLPISVFRPIFSFLSHRCQRRWQLFLTEIHFSMHHREPETQR